MTTPGATEAVTPEQRATDRERIWLEPNCAGPARTWCEDNVWPAGCKEAGCDTPPTEYIRADLVEAKAREAETNALRRAADDADKLAKFYGDANYIACHIRSLLPKEEGK